MPALYRDLTTLLRAEGWRFLRSAKGDHEIWSHPDRTQRLTIDKGVRSRHTANAVLKQAGLAKAL